MSELSEEEVEGRIVELTRIEFAPWSGPTHRLSFIVRKSDGHEVDCESFTTDEWADGGLYAPLKVRLMGRFELDTSGPYAVEKFIVETGKIEKERQDE